MNIIKRIISVIRIIPTYFFLNIRRYIIEKKLQKITNNDLLNNGFVKFNSGNGKKLAKYLEGSLFNLVNRNFTSKFMVPNIYLRNK